MSEAPQSKPETPRAKDVNLQAAAWLERREAANWTSDDAAELDVWLAASEANCAAFWRVEAAWQEAQRLAALQRGTRVGAYLKGRQIWPYLARVVAATIVVVALLAGWQLLTSRESKVDGGELYSTPVGGREVLALADGSQIELNTNSAVRIDISANRRLTTLVHGEAFFQIKHDAAHPFVVMAQGHRITDLGTRFLVRERGDGLEVALMEGRARVDVGSTEVKSAMLLPGDVAVAKENALIVVHKSPRELKSKQAWRQGVLIFDHITLAEAASEFNRYNRVKLVIADAATAKRRFGGTFPTNDLDDFTGLARSVLGLRVENRGQEIVISR
jgi:transmembrane sensor